MEAAQQYFEKAIDQNGASVTMDKGDPHLVGIPAVDAGRESPVKIRQVTYLNEIVEWERRARQNSRLRKSAQIRAIVDPALLDVHPSAHPPAHGHARRALGIPAAPG